MMPSQLPRGPLAVAAGPQAVASRLVPRTQLQRNSEAASRVPGHPVALPFVLRSRSRAVAGPPPTRPHVNVTSRFGLRIRRLRVERNLTQTRMAEEFGIDRTFLSDLECGRKSVTLPTLERLARGFGMTLSELFEGV